MYACNENLVVSPKPIIVINNGDIYNIQLINSYLKIVTLSVVGNVCNSCSFLLVILIVPTVVLDTLVLNIYISSR